MRADANFALMVSSATYNSIVIHSIAKEQEEHRLLDAVLHRLQLTPANVEKSECPDFFFRLGSSSVATIGCELVRFHSTPEGASTLGHGLRWKRFAERLAGHRARGLDAWARARRRV